MMLPRPLTAMVLPARSAGSLIPLSGVTYSAFGGLSGVNYALFGYAWLTGRMRPHEQIGTDSQTAIILFAWLALCMTGAMGPVANTAHLAGLLVGLAVAWAAAKLPRIRFRSR